jgi:hypothetical protein
MTRTVLITAFLCAATFSAFCQSIAVEDFTTTQTDIRPLMTGATDVFRSALLKNSIAEISIDKRNAAYVITGTVTRFGPVQSRQETAKGGGGFSGSVNVAINLFNFLAPSLQTGHIGSQNRSDKAAKAAEAEPRVVVSAQMIEAATGRIAASGTISAQTWEDYLAKADELALSFLDRLPFPVNVFSGVWATVIEHDGSEDAYRLTFFPGGRCTAEVVSTDAWGGEKHQRAEGRYTYNSEILSINARFDNAAIAGLRRIEWRVVITLAADRRSFSAVIPVSSQQGAARVQAVFRKE